MDLVKADATPAEEWLLALNAACNRLTTQYLSLLKAAGPTPLGTAKMTDAPPPPLAATLAISTLQCQLAAENICVAASNILSLIRTVRLSLLLMDKDTVTAEEIAEVERTRELTVTALQEVAELEQQVRELQAKAMIPS